MALLEGRIYEVLRPYLDKEVVDFRPYLSVTRSDIVAFLTSRPAIADKYFAEHSRRQIYHDGVRLWRSGVQYHIADMDHGKPRSEKRFDSLAEAVAEHVLITHGMY